MVSGKEKRAHLPNRRGFTLIESTIACMILLAVVVAVTGAITAGQQHSLEAHQRIAGTLAAEEMMGRLVVAPYDTLSGWNGYTEAVGAMTDMEGNLMPESFIMVGRNVTVESQLRPLGDLGVNIRGRNIRVRAVNDKGRNLIELTRFVPEPQS